MEEEHHKATTDPTRPLKKRTEHIKKRRETTSESYCSDDSKLLVRRSIDVNFTRASTNSLWSSELPVLEKWNKTKNQNNLETCTERGHCIIKAGTVERIIDWLTENPDDPALSSFLLLYIHFITPSMLCMFLITKVKYFSSLQPQCVSKFIANWVRSHFTRDFVHPKSKKTTPVYNRLLILLELLSKMPQQRDKTNEIKLSILHINQTKLRTLTHLNHTQEKSTDTTQEVKEEVPQLLLQRGRLVSPLVGSPKGGRLRRGAQALDGRLRKMSLWELAIQLSSIELELFRKIRLRELYNNKWRKSESKRTCRHVLRFIDRTNHMSYWVATNILDSNENHDRVSPEIRCDIIKRMIRLASKCHLINNFNTVMEIIGGLNMQPIRRLKETWKLLPESYHQRFAALEVLMDSRHNYRNYREALSKSKLPALPFLGVYLRDLTFVEEGNPVYTDKTSSVLNVERLKLLGTVLSELKEYQNQYNVYNWVQQDQREFLKSGLWSNNKRLNEEELYTLSYFAEPSTPTRTSSVDSRPDSFPIVPLRNSPLPLQRSSSDTFTDIDDMSPSPVSSSLPLSQRMTINSDR
eukprot:TRINITY_DN3079_c0_g1_i1.p1 TRINITY_DN3079_c0_g1~~TRINITY_DN3079_c0_g1_i1.p1  ORF type:complete len:579 (+),score=113.02 TRINITY_DN3079_c0_g1_i1:81-1817(+)